MSDDEEFHPELAEYVPGRGSSLRHPAVQRVLRVTVIVGVLALVVPGALATVAMQARTADAACRLVVAGSLADAGTAEARFELAGAAGPGWYCYAREFDGTEVLLRGLGIIPGLD